MNLRDHMLTLPLFFTDDRTLEYECSWKDSTVSLIYQKALPARRGLW
jgi:hypothetical protein